jgi:hypothetical protein
MIQEEKVKVEHYNELWKSQAKSASNEQTDKVGLLYITKVLGVDEEIAKRFMKAANIGKYDQKAFHIIGLRQGGIPCSTDTKAFWEKIQKIFPDQYSEDDIEFLTKKGGVSAVLSMLYQFETTNPTEFLLSLSKNAHIYK